MIRNKNKMQMIKKDRFNSSRQIRHAALECHSCYKATVWFEMLKVANYLILQNNGGYQWQMKTLLIRCF